MQAKVQVASLLSSCRGRGKGRASAGNGAVGVGVVTVIIVVVVQGQGQGQAACVDALPSWPCHPCWSSLHGHGCIVNAAAGSSGWLWWWLRVDS